MAESINFSINGTGSDDVIRRVKGIFDALRKATAQQKLLNQQLDILRDRSAGNRTRKRNLIEELTGDPTKNKEAFALLKSGIKSLDTEIKGLGKSLGGIGGSLPGSALAKHRAEIKKLENAYHELAKAGKAGSNEAKNLITQITAQSKTLNTAISAVNKAKNAGKETTSTAGGLFGNFGDALSNIFKFQAASFVIDTIAQAITYAAQTVVEFEAEIVNLGAILDKGGAQSFEDLKAQALTLGQTTAFTATEVVKLQTELVKLGFTGKEVLNVTAPVVDFSTAVRESADAVALLTGATLKAFNLSVLETRRVVDVLTQGTIDTALSFGYLETALPIVSSAADAANISLEETVSVLGVLADRGVQASTSATAFRNILIESAQRGITYREALELLQNSTNKLSIAFDLFGKRGAVQALILAENIGEVDSQVKRLEDRLITAREISQKQLNSMRGDVTLLKSAWDGFLLSLGNTGPARAATAYLTDILNGITSLISGTIEWNDVIRQNPILSATITNPLTSLIDGSRIVNKLQSEYNLILRTSSEYIQDLALSKQGIFEKDIKLISVAEKQKLIQEETAKVVKELQKQGINDLRTISKAGIEVAKNISGVFDTLAKQRQKLREQFGDDDLLKIDPKALTTLQSLNSYLSELKSIQERTPIGSEEYNLVQKKIAETERLLGKTVKDSKTNELGYLDSLIKKVGEYEKALKNTQTETVKVSLIEDINETQGKIDKQLALNRDFYSKLDELQLKFSSEAVKKERYKIEKENFDKEEALRIEQYKAQLNGEKVNAKAIEQIQNEFALKYQGFIVRTTRETEQTYQESLDKLKELGAEGFKISVELQKIKFDEFIDRSSAERVLEITRDITNEGLRKQLLDQNDNDNAILRVQNELSRLEALQAVAKTMEVLGQVGASLNNDDKLRINQLKAQELILQRQAVILQSQVDSNSNRLGTAEELEYLKKVKEAQQNFIDGKIPAQEFNVVTGEIAKNPFEVLLQHLEDYNRQYEEARLKRDAFDIQAENTALDEKGLLTDQDRTRELKAYNAWKAAKAKLDDDAGKDERDRQARDNRELLNQRKKLLQEFFKISQTFGEAIGAALVNEEGTKEAFKDLMKSLIDIFIQFIVAQLTAELLKEGALLNFGKVATIGLGVAAVSALGGALKAQIDKFELGGIIGDKYADGGIVQGPSHKNGGVKFRVRNTNYFPELEGEETIINKRSSKIFRKELSRINSYNGYGRRFEDGGIIQNAPQVLNPSENSVNLSDDAIIRQATLIAEKITQGQLTVMAEQNGQLVDALKKALDFNNRLTERLQQAQQNSRI